VLSAEEEGGVPEPKPVISGAEIDGNYVIKIESSERHFKRWSGETERWRGGECWNGEGEVIDDFAEARRLTEFMSR
jgi:hypothetical protein